MIGGCALNHGLGKVRARGKGPCAKVWDVRARWLCTVRDSTSTCGNGMEKSIGSPRMRVFGFKAAGAVVGDAEAILVKRASVLPLT